MLPLLLGLRRARQRSRMRCLLLMIGTVLKRKRMEIQETTAEAVEVAVAADVVEVEETSEVEAVSVVVEMTEEAVEVAVVTVVIVEAIVAVTVEAKLNSKIGNFALASHVEAPEEAQANSNVVVAPPVNQSWPMVTKDMNPA